VPVGLRRIELALEPAAEKFPRLIAMLDLMIRKPDAVPCAKHPRHLVKVDEVNDTKMTKDSGSRNG
jgi:hypothetical protein